MKVNEIGLQHHILPIIHKKKNSIRCFHFTTDKSNINEDIRIELSTIVSQICGTTHINMIEIGTHLFLPSDTEYEDL